jgi:hypothetical protein
MEDLINELAKKFPNYYDLGEAVHRIHVELQKREKDSYEEYDKINANIQIKKMLREMR